MKTFFKGALVVLLVALSNMALIVLFTIVLLQVTPMPLEDLLKTKVFINGSYLLSMMCTVFFIVYFKQEKMDSIPYQRISILFLIGIFFSLGGNFIIHLLTHPTYQSPSIFLLIETGILGPVLEEYVYRGYLFTMFQNTYSKKKAIFLTTLLFSLSHMNWITSIYAFFLGMLLMHVYCKNNNLTEPIFLHIVVNMTALFLPPLLF